MSWFTLLAVVLTVSCNVAAVTYYVTPSVKTGGCPGEPCLPLTNYTADSDQYFISGATFVFLPGLHELSVDGMVVIRDIANLSWVGSEDSDILYSSGVFVVDLNTPAVIYCSHVFSGFTFMNITGLKIRNLGFIGCGYMIEPELVDEALFVQTTSPFFLIDFQWSALFLVNVQSLMLESVLVYDSLGYGLIAINVVGEVVIDKCYFSKNNHITYLNDNCTKMGQYIQTDCIGGNAILAFSDPAQCPTSAETHTVIIKQSTFELGIDVHGAFTSEYWLTKGTGLGVYFAQKTYGVHLVLKDTVIHGNTGGIGANLYIQSYNDVENATVMVNNCLIYGGNAAWPNDIGYHSLTGEGLAFVHGMVNNIHVKYPSLKTLVCPSFKPQGQANQEVLAIYNTYFAFNGHSKSGIGAAMILSVLSHTNNNLKRSITMDGIHVMRNTGVTGTAMWLIAPPQQEVDVTISNSQFSENMATEIIEHEIAKENQVKGIYQLYQVGTLMFSDARNVTIKSCLFLNNELTAVVGIKSEFTFEGVVLFENNTGANGGAISLLGDSVMYLKDKLNLGFIGNTATKRGGAIYIPGDFLLDSNCFFQLSNPLISPGTNSNISMFFANNTALEAGDALYGGAVDHCSLYASGLQSYSDSQSNQTAFFSLATFMEEDTGSIISSDAELCCICVNGNADCSLHNSSITLFPGQSFYISLVAVGQLQGTVPAVVQAYITPPTSAQIDPLQELQKTERYCVNLTYTLSSHNNTETVVFYPDGVYPSDNSPQVIVHLLPCPLGFHLSKGQCVCSQPLQDRNAVCNIEHETVTRKPPYWFSTATGDLAYHDHCPFDYCRDEDVEMKLDDPNQQCAFSHSGLLCGGCKDGLSLTLGTSKCKNCSNIYLLLIIPFAIKGILLVVMLSVLNLTVRMGTIHGLIFYANIVKINQAVFFPEGENSFFTVFISWLNLDFGIESCFFDGLDAYSKTWLQFAFPLYLWCIGAVIIISARFSTRISEIFNNAVHVLDTLFLLSYTKILRAIITALSFTVIRYQGGHSQMVWLYDANVEYGEAKHIPLIIFSALFFIVGLAYTSILLFVQPLCRFSHKRAFRWVEKIEPHLDAYTGPYESLHSYWTGLLLLARVLAVLVFTFNILGEPAVNRLVVSSVACLLAVHVRGVYKNKFLDALEASFLLNLAILSIGTCYIAEAGGNQMVLINTSVSITCVELLGILVYHISLYLKHHGVRLSDILHFRQYIRCCNLYRRLPAPDNNDEQPAVGLDELGEAQPAVPTTYIDIRGNQQ